MKVKELLNQINEKNLSRYYRPADYHRRAAMTKFLIELEQQCEKENKSFELVSASGYVAYMRNPEIGYNQDKVIEETRAPLLETYFGVIVDGVYTYLQWDENPFFPHYYSRANVFEQNGKKKYSEVYLSEYKQLAIYTEDSDAELLKLEDVFSKDGNEKKIVKRFWDFWNTAKMSDAVRNKDARIKTIEPHFYINY